MPVIEDKEDDAGTFRKALMAPQPVEYLTHDELERHRRLIKIEPELSQIVEGKRAWAIVTETLKKIALLLTALSGGFFVLRELIRGLAG